MLDQALFSFWRSSARVSTKRGKGGLPIIDLLPKPPESDEKLCYMKFQVTDREKQHILSLVPQWAQFKGARESDDAIALRCLTRGLRANREPPQWFYPLRSPQLAEMVHELLGAPVDYRLARTAEGWRRRNTRVHVGHCQVCYVACEAFYHSTNATFG